VTEYQPTTNRHSGH